MQRSRARVVAGAVLAVSVAALAAGDEAYRAEIRAWRKEREARLSADGGWLSVAGLFWLKDGENPFGCDPSLGVVLPPGSAPARAGVFALDRGKVTVTLAPGVVGRIGGEVPRGPVPMRPDTSGSPDVLRIGALSLHVIERGDRFGIRLKDENNPARKSFTGLHWYPVQERYRIEARWVPYDPPRTVNVANVLGQVVPMVSPGAAEFTLEGRTIRLDAVLEEEGAKELFFIFRDLTSGKQTYGAGRFLYADLPRNGRVVLDFNKAYNPPCAFTPYATCPLPPRQNRMPVRVEAGELAYGKAH
jgi:uncharacterized protein (DUF1684 family)